MNPPYPPGGGVYDIYGFLTTSALVVTTHYFGLYARTLMLMKGGYQQSQLEVKRLHKKKTNNTNKTKLLVKLITNRIVFFYFNT